MSHPFDRLSLCQAVWGWPESACSDDTTGENDLHQHVNRLKGLETFFAYYKDVVASYVPEQLGGVPAALNGQADLFALIRHIKHNVNTSRQELLQSFFNPREINGQQPTKTDQDRALNTAMKILAMIDCTTNNSHEAMGVGVSLLNKQPPIWTPGRSYNDLWNIFFTQNECPEIENEPSASILRSSLTARKLVKVTGLKLIGTNDLRNHLRLDSKSGVVGIYHHTSVLKQHLLQVKNDPSSHCSIPPALAVTRHSMTESLTVCQVS
ncbi:hypothetical protein QBC38DRAFT_526717 [Podospora fimiseda]|uniref:Uncharacterized protein n=1 Tax=Podospora fimiseda TaxID=252190 RepID=A0AAN7BQ27_9PEZI|nr:hypothetical protein QBC38DRAFT_526717 [Podospora fimiseda]